MAEMEALRTRSRSGAPKGGHASSRAQQSVGEENREGGGMLHAFMALQQSHGNQVAQRYARQLKGPAAGGGSGAPVQMKEAVMPAFAGAHMRGFTETADPADASGNTKIYKVNENAKVGKKIGWRTKFEDKEKQDETGNWQMVSYDGATGFIRKEKVKEAATLGNMAKKLSDNKTNTGQIGGQAGALEDEGLDGAAEQTGETVGYATDSLGDASDKYSALGEKIGDDKMGSDATKVGEAGAVTGFLGGGLGGLMAMKKGVSAYRSTTMTGSEKAGAIAGSVAEGGESLHKTFDSTAKLIDGGAKIAGHEKGVGASTAVAGWSGSVGEAIGAIKNGFSTVKGIYDIFKEVFSTEGPTADEVISGSLSVLSSALKTAQSVVKTVKAILDILKVGTAALGSAIPAIGIAISGIEITLKVYNMIKSAVNNYRMTKIKRDFKSKYTGKDYVADKKLFTIRGRDFGKSKGVDKTKLNARKEELAANGVRSKDEQQELDDMREYELAKEMKSINNKRIVRASMKVGIEMVNIAGEIATLSGVGAKVGVPLKVAAAGAGVSMSIARRVKQFGRDRAAKPTAWKATKAIFNAEKSTEKKHAKRVQDAEVIMQMISELPEMDGSEDIKKQYEHVENFITATGCSTKELYRLNGNPSGQIDLLVAAMKKRE